MSTPMNPRHRVAALGGALVLGAVALGACATPSTPAASSAVTSSSTTAAQRASATDPSTIDLVSAATNSHRGADRADRGFALRLRHVLHATWVTGGKTPTTHDAIRGEVTAVSATSITVKARDGVSMTFAVGSSTKVRVRHDGTGSASSIGQVKVGDRALVLGVGTTQLTARHVLYRAPAASPGAASPSTSTS